MQTEKLNHIRHSLAHILASSVLEMFPDAKLGVGPVIETGFYYDFQLPRSVTPEDLKALQKRMKHLVKQNLAFERQETSSDEASAFFAERQQPFKVELIEDIKKFGTTVLGDQSAENNAQKESTDTVSLYKTGEFIDLCRGGHVENTNEIDPDSFMLDKVSGAYWRGDQNNPQMQRLYGLAFESKEQLDAHLTMREEAEKRDHKKLGPQLDLFVFSDLVGAGLPLFTPKGTVIRDALDSYVWSLRKDAGYDRVDIPHITKKDLYERSGHWDKFKDELFNITTREGHVFAMKPMNCPHHTQIYDRKKWSYRELPQRYASTTKVYRDEQSGELAGLSRVRAITQDDAHVFCRPSQVKEELKTIWEIVQTFYATFGFNLRVRLSMHDPANQGSYLGDSQNWEKAENTLRELASEMKTETFEGIGEAAFYGPKLDFMATDSIGREWQVATIQLDFNMPERFELSCIGEDGNPERIFMLHAAIMGSIERFMSVLIEHYAGVFPLWLSPVQASILPISDKHLEYAHQLEQQLKEHGFRIELDARSESIGKKIREATTQKIPYMLVVGDKETENQTVAIRTQAGEDGGTVSIADAISKFSQEIANKN
jgi:threonyl-tRNA synthetase